MVAVPVATAVAAAVSSAVCGANMAVLVDGGQVKWLGLTWRVPQGRQKRCLTFQTTLGFGQIFGEGDASEHFDLSSMFPHGNLTLAA